MGLRRERFSSESFLRPSLRSSLQRGRGWPLTTFPYSASTSPWTQLHGSAGRKCKEWPHSPLLFRFFQLLWRSLSRFQFKESAYLVRVFGSLPLSEGPRKLSRETVRFSGQRRPGWFTAWRRLCKHVGLGKAKWAPCQGLSPRNFQLEHLFKETQSAYLRCT